MFETLCFTGLPSLVLFCITIAIICYVYALAALYHLRCYRKTLKAAEKNLNECVEMLINLRAAKNKYKKAFYNAINYYQNQQGAIKK